MKPTVYCDTSIFSACWYEGNDVALIARRLHTREWWNMERRHFDVWGSGIVETELRDGTYPGQENCVRTIRRLRFLQQTSESRNLAAQIVQTEIVPASKASDADHLALCATHDIDFLLTWNYAHMANPIVQQRFGTLCDSLGLSAPLMVSPESIPQVRFGQSIRRKR